MESISRVDQVLVLLRQQLAARSGKPAQSAQPNSIGAAQASVGQPLLEVLIRRLAELRAKGLTDRSALTRLLIEQMLTAQVGEHLLNDGSFQRVVDDVQQALEADADLRESLEELLAADQSI